MDRVGVTSLVVVVCSILIMFPFFSTVCADYQVDALMAFKAKLSPQNLLSDWVADSDSPCSWFHITCYDDNISVQRINIQNMGLSGTLVKELGNLTKLQYMNMFENKIRGSIPAAFGKLANLLALNLYDNRLSGTIPKELGNLKKLRVVYLQNNQLSGKVPDVFAKGVTVLLSGNPKLCGANTDPYKKCK